jgi:hypothetical protein
MYHVGTNTLKHDVHMLTLHRLSQPHHILASYRSEPSNSGSVFDNDATTYRRLEIDFQVQRQGEQLGIR